MPLFSKKITPTEITSNIEKATNPSVTELDWSLVFQICDSVNSSELGAKEARKLLQKKMMSNDPKVQVLGLEILNSLAENCTAKFQPQLGAKSFGEDLYTLVSSKNLDDRVHGKLAQCLETWAGQTAGDPQFNALKRAYDIIINGNALQGGRRQQQTLQSVVPREPPKPRDVKADIELAKNSAQLFSQTLSFTDPTAEDISKNELIQEFYSKCKHAQQLIAGHLETCNESETISQLINTNNELLSCFKSYDEMLEQKAVNDATINSQSLNDRSTRKSEEREDTDLIGSSSSNAIPAETNPTQVFHSNNPFQAHTMNKQNSVSDDPFDPFADTNQVETNNNNTSNNNNSGNTVLPPPLTPQRMHD